jgi:hypothetical protein
MALESIEKWQNVIIQNVVSIAILPKIYRFTILIEIEKTTIGGICDSSVKVVT